MNFFTKKLMQMQLKNLPKEQQELIMAMMEKNPDLFMRISNEIKAKKKAGMDEQMAMMQVMMAHKHEMEKLVRELQKK